MVVPRLVLAVAVCGWAATALAQKGLDAPIERYREAAGGRELGAVKGRAFQERRRPSVPDTPLTGTTIALLPRSESWLIHLQAIKHGARDSMDAYREAVTVVRRSREAYEKSLLEAGAGDLPQAATVDSGGTFVLEGVPAGPWILLASRSTYVGRMRPERADPTSRPGVLPPPFLPQDRVIGYDVVTYWLRELTIVAGAVEAIDLTDRNIWLTGVAESRKGPRLPDQPYQPRR